MTDLYHPIEIDSDTLEHSYENCRTAVNKYFSGFSWMIGNLTGLQKRDLIPVLNYLITVVDLLDLKSDTGLPLDAWKEVYSNLEAAFNGQADSPDFLALVDTARRHPIPQQLFLDALDGANLWIRNNRFSTWEELETFAAHIGGSLMTAAVPALGFIKPGYSVAATECGKAVFITQLLANIVPDAKHNRVFLAQNDLRECEVDIHRIKLRKPIPTLKHLVRLYTWRIEKMLSGGSPLLAYLDFDGRRSISSLLGWTWKTMNQMRIHPESVLNESGVLSRSDLLKLRAKHLLGLEGNLPFQVEAEH